MNDNIQDGFIHSFVMTDFPLTPLNPPLNAPERNGGVVEESLFLALAQHIAEPLFLLDLDDPFLPDKIVFANSAVAKSYGYSVNDILGKSLRFFDEQPCLDDASKPWDRLTAQETVKYERRHQRFNGISFSAEIEGRFVEWQGRRMAIVILHDITKQQLAKEHEQQHQADMSRVAHLVTLGQMAARITHEISQPLFAITNYTSACVEVLSKAMNSARMAASHETGLEQAAESRSGATKEFVAANSTKSKNPSKLWSIGEQEASNLLDWLKQVATQSSRAGEVLRSLANFTRSTPVNRVAILPDKLVRNAVDLLNVDLREHEVKVEYGFDSESEPVLCEPILIEQVLVNLIRNGSESMVSLDHEQRKIFVRIRRLEKFLEFAVIDSGPAIELDVLHNTLDSFFTTGADGRGRGFAISRTIIEAQGGRLWAEKNFSQGMTVFFTLPFTRSMEPITNVL